jgi:hypothetical protein
MHDQAEGLRRSRKAARILSVLSLPQQPDSAGIASRLALAWRLMGGQPLLVDGTGRSAARLLGCQPLLDWSLSSRRSFADCVLVQEGRAAVAARGVQAGDADLAGEAARLGYREIVFDGGEITAQEAPLDPALPQDILLLAGPDQTGVVYALLKGLHEAQSPARTWLLWHNQSAEALRLQQVCSQRLGRTPRYFDNSCVSRTDHGVTGNGASASLRDEDLRSIVATMLAEQSPKGEETPSTIKRHG